MTLRSRARTDTRIWCQRRSRAPISLLNWSIWFSYSTTRTNWFWILSYLNSFLNVIFIYTVVNFKTNIFDGALWPLIQDRKKNTQSINEPSGFRCKCFYTIVLFIFLSDTFWKKGFQISMSRFFCTVCTFFHPKIEFFQKMRTFAFSKNRTFPKKEDFCVFAKKYFSKKSGLSP